MENNKESNFESSLPQLGKVSVIIPVYNSEKIVEETVDRTVSFFETQKLDFEIILINDGSKDNSWVRVKRKALLDNRIRAINFLRNYGQHTALYAGLKVCKGDYAVTLDDDLQNPPEEIIHLLEKAMDGYDLVIGEFNKKQHAGYRRVGTILIRMINQRIFHQPKGLALSNFRLIRKDVIGRMINYRTSYPYVTGLAIMFSANPVNVGVEHKQRPVGKSNYNWRKIFELVMRLLFNYSSFPLRLISMVGGVISIGSFFLSMFYLIRGLMVGAEVPGWTTVVVMLSFFNSISLLLVSMLGEYLIRLLTQFSNDTNYCIREFVNE